jgi:ABC-type dipeptide/oligopeptide/nickel transport system ATPase component
MRLARLTVKNFRCYKDEFSIDFDNLTVLVGKNDVGKSSIFEALAIFFDEAALDSDDGSISGDKRDVHITCEFDNLPSKLILDSDFETSLADEYLLNEHGRLELHKVYNGTLQKPKLTSVFIQALHPSKKGLDDLLTLTLSKLKDRAKSLGVDIKDVYERVNSLIRKKLWASATNLDIKPVQIFLDKDDAKNIWERLKIYLPSFALFKSDRPSTDQDEEAQDPMKAAIKEALKAKEAELKSISEFVEQEVSRIAQQTLTKLNEMDPSLAGQLSPRFTPPNWSAVFKVSLTGDDEVPINKRGSGTRRLILLNFFRAKAEQLSSDKPSIIYAIEEPETSQHPNNQKMLMRAFSELASQPDCQVLLSTHTPVLARLVPDNNLRYISIDPSGRRCVSCGDDTTRQLLANTLGVLPEHDVKIFIGVEGVNDINFLINISKVLSQAGKKVPNLGDLENQGKIIFFPLGGSNLALWKTRLANLNRPEFYIFDRDTTPPTPAKYQSNADELNRRSNCKAVITSKKEMENYLHPDSIFTVMGVRVSFSDFDDVPILVAQAKYPNWAMLSAEDQRKKESHIKKMLNSNVADKMTPALLTSQDPNNEIRSWLSEIASYL